MEGSYVEFIERQKGGREGEDGNAVKRGKKEKIRVESCSRQRRVVFFHFYFYFYSTYCLPIVPFHFIHSYKDPALFLSILFNLSLLVSSLPSIHCCFLGEVCGDGTWVVGSGGLVVLLGKDLFFKRRKWVVMVVGVEEEEG